MSIGNRHSEKYDLKWVLFGSQSHEFRFIFRIDNEVVLIDGSKMGYICHRKEFNEDYEISQMLFEMIVLRKLENCYV